MAATAFEYAQKGEVTLLDELLNSGAEVDTVVDESGRTLLHAACVGGKKKVLRYLMRRGLDIDAADKHGVRPIHLCEQHGHSVLCDYLVSKGALPLVASDPGAEDSQTADFGAQGSHDESNTVNEGRDLRIGTSGTDESNKGVCNEEQPNMMVEGAVPEANTKAVLSNLNHAAGSAEMENEVECCDDALQHDNIATESSITEVSSENVPAVEGMVSHDSTVVHLNGDNLEAADHERDEGVQHLETRNGCTGVNGGGEKGDLTAGEVDFGEALVGDSETPSVEAAAVREAAEATEATMCPTSVENVGDAEVEAVSSAEAITASGILVAAKSTAGHETEEDLPAENKTNDGIAAAISGSSALPVEAVITIQCCVRRHHALSLLRMLIDTRATAVLTVQRNWRVHSAHRKFNQQKRERAQQKRVEQVAAVQVLSCVFRQHLARLTFFNLSEDQFYNVSATQIQCAVRGWRARRIVQTQMQVVAASIAEADLLADAEARVYVDEGVSLEGESMYYNGLETVEEGDEGASFGDLSMESDCPLILQYLSNGSVSSAIGLARRSPERAAAVDQMGNTALHVAATNVNLIDALEALLPVVDARALNHDFLSALHIAAAYGNSLGIHVLCSGGCDPYAVDTAGNCALHLAVASGNGESVRILLEAGPDVVFLQNKQGNSPYELALGLEADECVGAILNMVGKMVVNPIVDSIVDGVVCMHDLLTAKNEIEGTMEAEQEAPLENLSPQPFDEEGSCSKDPSPGLKAGEKRVEEKTNKSSGAAGETSVADLQLMLLQERQARAEAEASLRAAEVKVSELNARLVRTPNSASGWSVGPTVHALPDSAVVLSPESGNGEHLGRSIMSYQTRQATPFARPTSAQSCESGLLNADESSMELLSPVDPVCNSPRWSDEGIREELSWEEKTVEALRRPGSAIVLNDGTAERLLAFKVNQMAEADSRAAQLRRRVLSMRKTLPPELSAQSHSASSNSNLYESKCDVPAPRLFSISRFRTEVSRRLTRLEQCLAHSSSPLARMKDMLYTEPIIKREAQDVLPGNSHRSEKKKRPATASTVRVRTRGTSVRPTTASVRRKEQETARPMTAPNARDRGHSRSSHGNNRLSSEKQRRTPVASADPKFGLVWGQPGSAWARATRVSRLKARDSVSRIATQKQQNDIESSAQPRRMMKHLRVQTSALDFNPRTTTSKCSSPLTEGWKAAGLGGSGLGKIFKENSGKAGKKIGKGESEKAFLDTMRKSSSGKSVCAPKRHKVSATAPEGGFIRSLFDTQFWRAPEEATERSCISYEPELSKPSAVYHSPERYAERQELYRKGGVMDEEVLAAGARSEPTVVGQGNEISPQRWPTVDPYAIYGKKTASSSAEDELFGNEEVVPVPAETPKKGKRVKLLLGTVTHGEPERSVSPPRLATPSTNGSRSAVLLSPAVVQKSSSAKSLGAFWTSPKQQQGLSMLDQ